MRPTAPRTSSTVRAAATSGLAMARAISTATRPSSAVLTTNPLTGREVRFANLFRTHPTTAERVARLRSESVQLV